jgi:diaminopimelate decarboxylase
MLMQKTMKINNQGHLEINGCDTVDLAASFGTPLMIIDEALLREKCQKYYQAFTQNGGDKVFYASKAFLTTALARIIEDEGLGLDVVSGGEFEYPEYKLEAEQKVVEFAAEAIKRAGLDVRLETSGGGSDANIFNAAGLQVANLAVGMQNAHTTEEFMESRDLVDVTHILWEMVQMSAEAGK